MSDDAHTTETALEAAGRDDLRRWVADFLASEGSDNAPLAEQLTADCPWWIGPVEVPLDDLHRLAGPPGAPVLEVVEDDWWRGDVDDLAGRIQGGHEPPPVVAALRDGRLVLEDGNHRVEALRRAGRDTTWAVVGFVDPAARDAFLERAGDA